MYVIKPVHYTTTTIDYAKNQGIQGKGILKTNKQQNNYLNNYILVQIIVSLFVCFLNPLPGYFGKTKVCWLIWVLKVSILADIHPKHNMVQ